MTLFATLTLYCIVRYVESQRIALVRHRRARCWASDAHEGDQRRAGRRGLRVPRADPVSTPAGRADLCRGACGCAGVRHAPGVAARPAGHASTGRSYLAWQLMRRPNHSMDFYVADVPPAVGLLVLAAAARWPGWLRTAAFVAGDPAGVLDRRTGVAFQVWPVKGFQYLLPIVAPLAVLAARGPC